MEMMVGMAITMNRRSVLQVLAVAPFAAQGWWAEGKTAMGGERTLFVGTQTGKGSDGIYAYRWDPATGELESIGLAIASKNPTFLALSPDKKYLYAANELENFGGTPGGGVSAFTVDAKAGKLAPVNTVSSGGAGTCHVSVDKTGKNVFCANYTGGSASSFHLAADGSLSEAVSHFQYEGHGPDKDRQEKPHAHRVTVSPANTHLMVNDLGLDCIHIYKLDPATGKLTPNEPKQWSSEPGAGPRALRFHPNGKFAYCITEMGSQIIALRWDEAAGSLETVQTMSLVPPDYKGEHAGCDVVIDHTGHYAYAADRFDDVIVSYKIDPATGKLTLLGHTKYGGKVPRDLTLDPTGQWLLVADQVSDTISVRKRDPKTNIIAETGKEFKLSKPQCLVFA